MLIHRWVQSDELVADRHTPGVMSRIIWRWYELVAPFEASASILLYQDDQTMSILSDGKVTIERIEWEESRQMFYTDDGRKYERRSLYIPGHLICEEKPATAPLKLRKVPDGIRPKVDQFFPQGA